MAESSLNSYSVNSSNQANSTPNPVSVVNDGTANRQIVVLGKGDGTTGLVDGSSSNPINITVATTLPVSGTVTETNSSSILTQDTSTATNTGTLAGTVSGGKVKVDPSGVTSPVSASSLPLPTGASTSAKQPALGTAGAASTDVLTVQGITSMTALKTDGSGVTQPVSGTVTANAGTNLNTSALALETGGNLANIATNQTNGTQQTKLTDGTNVANVAANNSATTGNAGNFIETGSTGYTTATITLNSGTPNTVWYDMLNYPEVSFEILTNTTPATLTFQTSNDAAQTNVRNMVLYDSQSTLNVPVSVTTTAVGTFSGPRAGRYFRISSNNGAGTTTLVITFYTAAQSRNSIGVASLSGTGTTIPGSAYFMGMSDGTNLRGLTTNSTTYTSKFAADTNLLGTLGTAFSTAGKVDVKGADGDVFVRQTTAANLNATTVPGNSTGGAVPAVATPIGVQARTTEATATTTTWNTIPVSDKVGKLITLPYANPENFVSAVATATGTTDTAVISAQGAGLFLYITSISVANTGSTTSLVTIEWDTASAKTAAWYMINPAGGGDNITFPNPLKAPVANKNVGFVCGSSSTTQYVSISGYYGV